MNCILAKLLISRAKLKAAMLEAYALGDATRGVELRDNLETINNRIDALKKVLPTEVIQWANSYFFLRTLSEGVVNGNCGGPSTISCDSAT